MSARPGVTGRGGYNRLTMIMRLTICLACVLAAGLIGCEDEEIRTYDAPKPTDRQDTPLTDDADAPQMPATPSTPTGDAELTLTPPDGWRALDNGGGMRLVGYEVGEAPNVATTTVIALGGQAGGTLANINRWRGQINLPPIDESQRSEVSAEMTVAGSPATAVELIGDEQSILAVILPRGSRTYFIKMTGPTQLVRQEKGGFRSLVRSVRFDEGDGAGDE